MDETKVCSKCGNEWPLDGFYRDRRRANGVTAECKACRSDYHARRKAENPDVIRAQTHAAVVRYRAKTGDARNRAVTRARKHALQRLAEACPAEFAAVYDAVLREHGLELRR